MVMVRREAMMWLLYTNSIYFDKLLFDWASNLKLTNGTRENDGGNSFAPLENRALGPVNLEIWRDVRDFIEKLHDNDTVNTITCPDSVSVSNTNVSDWDLRYRSEPPIARTAAQSIIEQSVSQWSSYSQNKWILTLSISGAEMEIICF